MVEVTGKTIGDLPSVESLNEDFMFLGCQGTDTVYTTWKAAYSTLSGDLKDVFMEQITPEINDRLTSIEKSIETSDGLYFRKNGEVTQEISSQSDFRGSVVFNNSVSFKRGNSVGSEYQVVLPKNSFRAVSSDTYDESDISNDNNRIAVVQDITSAVQGLKDELVPKYEQILDMSYAAYAQSVKISPMVSNSDYVYDISSDKSHDFYRYAGVKSPEPESPSRTWAEMDGAVYKQDGQVFNGVPLTKPYTGFKTLTLVCLADTAPSQNVNGAKNICSITIPVFDINLARRYVEYKSKYVNANNADNGFFDNISDRWYFNGSVGSDSVAYMSVKPSDVFTDTFLPLRFNTDGYCIIAVFGQK